ncbi:MAG: oligosaccharide flippase family protein, partial [Candidatus Aenigmarchaeota archaeon]|nr:oligosaccharide flippase family protein [Candidatus Aenigmarchaeota archaeon]
MKVAEKAVSNTIYLALNWLTLTGLSFLYWVIAGKLLLPSEYGKATTAYQIMFFLGSIANLGLGFAVSKVIPELIMKKQERKIPTIIKFSLKIALSIALVLAILLVLSTPLLNKKLGFNLRDTVFIALGLLFAQLSGFFSRVWYGYQNMKKIWINSMINQITKLAVASFLIYSGYKYFGPIAGLVAMYFVSFLLYFSPKIIRDGTRYNTRHLFYELAIPAFFANVFVMIFNNTQYIILSLMKNTEST